MKNSSSFSTPTATQDVTQSVNHQLAPLCQPSGALFTPSTPAIRGAASVQTGYDVKHLAFSAIIQGVRKAP